MNDLERTDLASPFLVLVQLREDGSREPGLLFFFFFFGEFWSPRLVPVQPKSSGSSRFPVYVLN